MPQYRAREPIYLSDEGRLIQTGDVFSSMQTPGHAWIALDSPPAAAVAPRKPAAKAKA